MNLIDFDYSWESFEKTFILKYNIKESFTQEVKIE